MLQQRLRTEVSQAKRETNFYLNNVDKSAHLEKLRKKRTRDGQQVNLSPGARRSFPRRVNDGQHACASPQAEERTWDFTQRQTEEEIQMKKRKKKKSSFTQKQLEKTHLLQQQSQSNVSLLAKIFNTDTNKIT